MTEPEVFDVIRAAVVRVLELDPRTVTRQSAFAADLHADSLALVEIVELVEEELAPLAPGLHLDDDTLDTLVTVGQAADYLIARLRHP